MNVVPQEKAARKSNDLGAALPIPNAYFAGAVLACSLLTSRFTTICSGLLPPLSLNPLLGGNIYVTPFLFIFRYSLLTSTFYYVPVHTYIPKKGYLSLFD